MKSKKTYLAIFLLIALAFSAHLQAQNDLQINKVFELYGKKKGVVMVSLSGEVLEEYNFSLFKSITIKNDPSAAEFIRKCLDTDGEGAKKIQQVVSSGILSSIYLALPRKGEINRLILYRAPRSENQITLIYIESKNESDKILKKGTYESGTHGTPRWCDRAPDFCQPGG